MKEETWYPNTSLGKSNSLREKVCMGLGSQAALISGSSAF